ncbi:MAG TPA: serine/threonine-protein kinase, partial [Gemmatales bacterium]|nr:serine/threonine-protein kinase [Gemmatales bacterium]
MSSSPGQPETVASHPGTASYQPTEGIGTVLGHYTLEQKLGEGGMGSVWIARQTEPVKRRVALKLIKTGLDSRSLLARFEQERQALAVMDHPHIAKVYDAGIAHGQPYFVMELVRGPTLLHYCDEKKLTPRQRLELFIPICHAIQHAHQKGIIHRDLKPANILVATVDDMPVPKIIDFGVAKAVSGKLTDQSFNTALGTVVGTLEYMAPEQAVGNDDVDTRVDIYALGVILYELLVGVRPFDGNRLRQAALLEAIRIIQDEDPSKPSTRLSTVESLPTIAAVRQVEPRQLLNMLRGDLDWIIMKCLEKERSRRYDTANGLALELQRYLHDEPVLASPPSAAYRWKKFVKRNKGSVLAAGLILLTLLLGILATSWAAWEASQQASAARRERDQKEEARLAEHQAKLLTEKRLQQIQKAQQLLGSIFTALDPTAENKQGRTLRQILVERVMRAEKELTGDAIGDPATVAELQDILGQSYHGLGEFKRARTLFEQAEATTLKLTHPQHPEYLRIKSNRAANEASDGHYQLALDLFEGILVQRQAIHGRNHPKTMITISDIAGVWAGHMQRGDKAIPLYEEV